MGKGRGDDSKGSFEEITTVSNRSEVADPIVEKLKSLKITTPILTSPPTESSLTDILVRKPSSSSVPASPERESRRSRSPLISAAAVDICSRRRSLPRISQIFVRFSSLFRDLRNPRGTKQEPDLRKQIREQIGERSCTGQNFRSRFPVNFAAAPPASPSSATVTSPATLLSLRGHRRAFTAQLLFTVKKKKKKNKIC